jgi:ATP-dependent DNA ligase
MPYSSNAELPQSVRNALPEARNSSSKTWGSCRSASARRSARSQRSFRAIARKIGKPVKLYSRPGNDLTKRFPLIVEAVAKLRASSCIINGEAVACGEDGIASFNMLAHWRHDGDVFLWAFDLIELNGDDLRLKRLEERKASLARIVAARCARSSVE